jgi:hypothetical protein
MFNTWKSVIVFWAVLLIGGAMVSFGHKIVENYFPTKHELWICVVDKDKSDGTCDDLRRYEEFLESEEGK